MPGKRHFFPREQEAHSCVLLHTHPLRCPNQNKRPFLRVWARMEHQHAFRDKGLRKGWDIPMTLVNESWELMGLRHHYSLSSNNIWSEIEQPGSHPRSSARIRILQEGRCVYGRWWQFTPIKCALYSKEACCFLRPRTMSHLCQVLVVLGFQSDLGVKQGPGVP